MGQIDSKITGAFLVGFSIVAGAYVLNSISSKPAPNPNNNIATVSEAPDRVFIDVKDSNNDGLEDWQEEFVAPEPVYLNQNSDEKYQAPDTVTGQTAISFFKNIVTTKAYGSQRTNEEVAEDTVKQVTELTKDKIFGTGDIIISEDLSGEAIRNYGNAMALAILNNDTDVDYEIDIMKNLVNKADLKEEIDEKDLEDLREIAKIYENTRDESLEVPVPRIFVKEHLDLINVYHALYKDIHGMSKIMEDSLLTLLRLKRYEDDALGLNLALENIFKVLEPYADNFTPEDPAVLFVAFSSEFNSQR